MMAENSKLMEWRGGKHGCRRLSWRRRHGADDGRWSEEVVATMTWQLLDHLKHAVS